MFSLSRAPLFVTGPLDFPPGDRLALTERAAAVAPGLGEVAPRGDASDVLPCNFDGVQRHILFAACFLAPAHARTSSVTLSERSAFAGVETGIILRAVSKRVGVFSFGVTDSFHLVYWNILYWHLPALMKFPAWIIYFCLHFALNCDNFEV